MIRNYSDLTGLISFNDRFAYLKLDGTVGRDTFGFDRYINQRFYKSQEWLSVRNFIIFRDNGCDLGVAGFEIHGRILVHHMNPISLDDIVSRSEFVLNPEYLISVTHSTHNAIHFSDEKSLIRDAPERSRNDTCPWKH